MRNIEIRQALSNEAMKLNKSKLQATEIIVMNHIKKIYIVVEKYNDEDVTLWVYNEADFKTYGTYLKARSNYELESVYFKYLNARKAMSISFRPKNQMNASKEPTLRERKNKFSIKQPLFSKYEKNKIPTDIKDSHDLIMLTQTLKYLSFYLSLNVPFTTDKDEMLNALSINEKGEYELSLVQNELLLQTKQAGYKNDIAIHRIKKLPRQATSLEVIDFLLTEPMQFADEVPSYPHILGIIEHSTSDVLYANVLESNGEYAVLEELINFLTYEIKVRPRVILVRDEDTHELLQLFCQQVGIELRREELSNAQQFKQHIMSQTKHDHENETFEDEIALIIETTSRVCEMITESSCFCQSLSPADKTEFKYIIELLHIMMMSQFQEIPTCWTPENFEYVIHQMFPKIFPQERLPIVFEMVREYIQVVGEAKTMPNYKQFLSKIKAPLSLI